MANGKYKVEQNGTIVDIGLSYMEAYRSLQDYGEQGGKVRMMPDTRRVERIRDIGVDDGKTYCDECGGYH